MGELVNISNKALSAAADVFSAEDDDLSHGAGGGFAVFSIRGSKWRIKHGGEEEPVVNADGEPVPSIEVALVKANPNLSKIYYAKAYEQGDASAPDCFSTDGVAPDAASTNRQSDTCAACPQNVWGSKISPAGKKTKACSDSRRVAVVPLGDLANERYNGPMLLRVPAASIADLSAYGKGMKAKGFPYQTIATRIGFDVNASYPKLTFKPIRALTDDEIDIVANHIRSGAAANVLATHEDAQPSKQATPAPKQESAVSFDFEDDIPVATAPPPKPKAAKKAAKPTPSGETSAENDDTDLDDILAELDS
jgi:hypothetical protein